MRMVLYTHSISPHELPLVRACVGHFDEVWYVVDINFNLQTSRKDWTPDFDGVHFLAMDSIPEQLRSREFSKLLDGHTLIMFGTRGNPYEAQILASSALIVYISERWLKPLRFVPGIAHQLQPLFRRVAKKYSDLILNNPRFFYFGIGDYAINDMARILGLGRCVELEREPVGKVMLEKGGHGKFRLWGYFVAPSEDTPTCEHRDDGLTRVLWVGRMLYWKRVDTLIRAVALAANGLNIRLTLVGEGPERCRLERLAVRFGAPVDFLDFVPIDEVRRLMRAHDVYVLSSNSYEGWGAVVNEALEEGMKVICSREAGAGATMLPEMCLFGAGDHRDLAEKLKRGVPRVGIGIWTPESAAVRLRRFADEKLGAV